MNIVVFILLIFLIRDKSINDPCLNESIKNLEMSPIYDIYLTSEKTNESVRLGYLEEYSSDNLNISSAEIYKWKDKYINVKRMKDEYKVKDINSYNSDTYSFEKCFNDDYNDKLNENCPITYIEFSHFPYSDDLQYYKTLKFDEYTYLLFTNKIPANKVPNLLLDFKVSFRYDSKINLKNNSDICFTHNCKIKEAYCYNYNLENIDYDDVYNLKYYNNISINVNNSKDYFEAERYYLYKVTDIFQDVFIKKNIKKFKKFYKTFVISIFLVNIFLRLIKFIISSLVEKPKKELLEDEKYCSVFNILFPIIHAINGALFLTLLLLSQKYGFYYNYASSFLQDVQLLLTIIELV